MPTIDQHNLELVLKTHFPIIVIETHEETRVIGLLEKIALRDGSRLLKWTAADGLTALNYKAQFSPSMESWKVSENDIDENQGITEAPLDMLEALKKQTRGSIISLLDFHPYINNPRALRALKEIAQECDKTKNKVVLISHDLEIPEEISSLCTQLTLSMPDQSTIRKMVLDEAKQWAKNNDKKVKADKKALDLLIKNLAGLTLTDAIRLVRNAIYTDGAITHSDVKEVMETKYQLVDQKGLLSFEYDTTSFNEVGGFKNLKKWLAIRKQHILPPDKNTSLDMPKGILLLGVQGCGKSLAAKAVAGAWGVPLIRLDFGSLYNKYIGETEKNIRETLASAEVLSPCVLWIDEIEKALQNSADDSGVTKRVLATLLTWMAENKKPVFIVATANDVKALPPELIRKGRMDEIFFVDLPNSDERKSILNIHLDKRKIDINNSDLSRIVQATKGFSGAELEQVVVSALYLAHSKNKRIDVQDLVNETKRTQPLSVVMAEQVNSLRNWANGRTVGAN